MGILYGCFLMVGIGYFMSAFLWVILKFSNDFTQEEKNKMTEDLKLHLKVNTVFITIPLLIIYITTLCTNG